MKIEITRSEFNPLIIPSDIIPTRENFKVDGVFNAGAAKYKDETILLLRVAESVITKNDNQVGVPLLEKQGENYELTIKYFDKNKDKERFDFSDRRSLWTLGTGSRRITNLTSLSHFRIARSKDGINFVVEDQPFIFPNGKYETWGIEDPRITFMDDVYYINYTAVSELGAATSLVKTKDFKSYERMGIIFVPENKDVTIFPEKIKGLYYAYHRPVPNAIGDPNIWVSTSTDLLTWGAHEHLISVAKDESWENSRIGGGAPPFKTDKGWVHIYHAADENNRYCLGVFITELEDPSKIIGKAVEPILIPAEKYEMEGFFGNVVFTCGILVEGEVVKIYYGASDQVIAMSVTTISELFKVLGV